MGSDRRTTDGSGRDRQDARAEDDGGDRRIREWNLKKLVDAFPGVLMVNESEGEGVGAVTYWVGDPDDPDSILVEQPDLWDEWDEEDS